MQRYKFLTKESAFKALNRLRNAFLAAKDGHEVDEIIKAILTNDERLKIGRRIQVSEMIKANKPFRDIRDALKVGLPTVQLVEQKVKSYPVGFGLIEKQNKKTESEYKEKAYTKIGGSKMIFKKKVYTGFKKSDVTR